MRKAAKKPIFFHARFSINESNDPKKADFYIIYNLKNRPAPLAV